MDESCEEGALRELKEETGLTGAYIEQFHTFSDSNRDPRERVITVAYYALVRIQDVKAGDWKSRAHLTPEGKATLTPENFFILTPLKS